MYSYFYLVLNNNRDGLRSISQRLERVLRQRREATESAAVAAITADASRSVLDLTAGSQRSVQTSGILNVFYSDWFVINFVLLNYFNYLAYVS